MINQDEINELVKGWFYKAKNETDTYFQFLCLLDLF